MIKSVQKSSLEKYIPDWDALVREITDNHPFRESEIHGEAHWKSVALTGYYLLLHSKNREKGDPVVILLFSLFHDSKRDTDGFDCCHGKRGGVFARKLHGKLHFITPAQMDTLQRACHEHTDGKTSSDPTIGICWDADRLNLFRIGINPSKKFLSTEIAREENVLEHVKSLEKEAHSMDWNKIFFLYGKLL